MECVFLIHRKFDTVWHLYDILQPFFRDIGRLYNSFIQSFFTCMESGTDIKTKRFPSQEYSSLHK